MLYLLFVALTVVFGVATLQWENATGRVILATITALSLIGAHRSFRASQQAQAAKNVTAMGIAQQTEESKSFGLYLRPFYVDPRTPKEPRLTAYGFDFGDGAEAKILERYVEESVRIALGLPVIGLAGRSEFFGPGMVQASDSEWQTQVSSLCQRAAAIIFVVGASEGALWELQFLKNHNLLGKTIFLLEPVDWYVRHNGPQRAAQLFEKSRDAFRRQGIEIPQTRPEAVVFCVDQRMLVIEQRIIVWRETRRGALAESLRAIRPSKLGS